MTGAYGGEKGKIPGYGHRVYGLYGRDPRATTLLEIARESGHRRRLLRTWPARSRRC